MFELASDWSTPPNVWEVKSWLKQVGSQEAEIKFGAKASEAEGRAKEELVKEGFEKCDSSRFGRISLLTGRRGEPNSFVRVIG